jgi:hypothetical protein
LAIHRFPAKRYVLARRWEKSEFNALDFRTEGTGMKKLIVTAAALIALSANPAAARSHATAIALNGFCNIYSITMNGNIAAAQDTPSCSGTYGGGMAATTRNMGKTVLLALQDQSGLPGVQMMLEVSYPFTTTGTFTLWQTTDGTNFQDAFDGTYTLDNAAEHEPGTKSITTVLHR